MLKWRKKIAVILVCLMCLTAAGCGGSNTDDSSGSAEKAAENTTYSIWIAKGESSDYYSDYKDNPVIQKYLRDTYIGKDEKEVKIDLEFLIPVAGSEKDNFNSMIATGDYADVMGLTVAGSSVLDLYEEGIAMDLTGYVEQYMPNYKNFLEKNPELALTATVLVDGEKKYLQLFDYTLEVDDFQGLCYRRDWIVKYGKNPVTGEPFSGEYTEKNEDGTWNTNTWVDNVVFPNGGTDPVYISDWEWMFGIFETALADLDIRDGYCMTIYPSGFNNVGVLNSSFGGGGPLWYKDKDNKVAFGGNNDEMRAYLQCVNTWYQNGWIDKAFPEHTGQLLWRLDEGKIRQGKVGLWHGMSNHLFGGLDMGDEYTKDIMVFACAYPINDIYGGPEQQYKEPYFLYRQSQEGPSYMVTTKALEKDTIALFRFLDSLYAEENAILNGFGLSKEEYEECQDPFYTKWGLTEGAYYDSGLKDETGRTIYYIDPIILNESGALNTAVRLNRLLNLAGSTSAGVVIDPSLTDQYRHAKNLWEKTYENTGMFPVSFDSQLSSAQAKDTSAVRTNVEEFMQKNLVTFIKGPKDPYNDSDWQAYCNAINKYNPDKVTQVFQEVVDMLK